MSAELLREAATRMRELAEKATPGPWTAGYDLNERPDICAVTGPKTMVWLFGSYADNDEILDGTQDDAEYIAAMYPGVAIALADWLDVAAGIAEYAADRGYHTNEQTAAALAVARAFLNREEATT